MLTIILKNQKVKIVLNGSYPKGFSEDLNLTKINLRYKDLMAFREVLLWMVDLLTAKAFREFVELDLDPILWQTMWPLRAEATGIPAQLPHRRLESPPLYF